MNSKSKKTYSFILPCDVPAVVISLAAAILVVFAFTINLKKESTGTGFIDLIQDVLRALQSFDTTKMLIFVLLFLLFLFEIGIIRQKTLRDMIYAAIPSVFFGIFMALGYSYAAKNSWELVFGGSLQFVKSFIYASGYTVLFFFLIMALFHFLDKASVAATAGKKHCRAIQFYLDMLQKHPFATTFITLFVLYLPYMILSYPAIFMGDNNKQIRQAYNIESFKMYFNFISDDVKLNNSHPVTHTLFIKLCLEIGRLLGSYNVGMFVYAMLQILFVFTVISFMIKILVELDFPKIITVSLILYYVISPRINNYMFLVTKDILATAFFMVFLLLLYIILTDKAGSSTYILIGLSIIGSLLFRHDSKYLILLSLVTIIFLIKKHRKKLIVMIAFTMCIFTLWDSVVLPAFKITPGGRREYLSIPLQQTARYVKEYGNEVTEEEKADIDAVVKYNSLAKSYDPIISDPIKRLFRENEATGEQIKTYLVTWFKMFFKHPGVYIEATLNNKYDMFYINAGRPDKYSYSWSETCMGTINAIPDEEFPIELSYPEALAVAKNRYERLRESLSGLPIVSPLIVPAVVIDLFIVWFVYALRSKNRMAIALTIPVIVQLLIIIAGPCQANYYRYVYPIVMILPAVILLGLHSIKTSHIS